jgi:hypothetical protein
VASGELSGVRAKIDRAKVHIASLKDEQRKFGESHPYTTREEAHPQASSKGHGSVSILVEAIDPVPIAISAIIGDAVFNLRSALDHLARQLVIANGGTPVDVGGGTSFPILDELPPTGLRQITGGVDAAALTKIESYQPTDGRHKTNNLLWILGELNNIDKHRVLLTCGLATAPPVVSMGIGPWIYRGEMSIKIDPWNPRLLKHGTQLANIAAPGSTSEPPLAGAWPAGTPKDTAVNVTVEMSPLIAFDEGELCEGQLVAEVLEKLQDLVVSIVNDLAIYL